MKPLDPASRAMGLVLLLALLLPSPAYALRVEAVPEASGLEELARSVAGGEGSARQRLIAAEHEVLSGELRRQIESHFAGDGKPAEGRLVIDVGSYDGSLLRSLEDLFGRFVAVENGEQGLSRLREIRRPGFYLIDEDFTRPGTVDMLPWKADLVLASHVLYDIPGTEGKRKALRKMIRLLAPHGQLLVVLNSSDPTPGTRAHLRQEFLGSERVPPVPPEGVEELLKEMGLPVQRRKIRIPLYSRDLRALTAIATELFPREQRQSLRSHLLVYLDRICQVDGGYQLVLEQEIISAVNRPLTSEERILREREREGQQSAAFVEPLQPKESLLVPARPIRATPSFLGLHPEGFLKELEQVTGQKEERLLFQKPGEWADFPESSLTPEERAWIRRVKRIPPLADEADLLLLGLIRRGEEAFEELFDTEGLRQAIHGDPRTWKAAYFRRREQIIRAVLRGVSDDLVAEKEGLDPARRRGLIQEMQRGERARDLFLIAHLRQILWSLSTRRRRYVAMLRPYGYSALEVFAMGIGGIHTAIRTYREGQGTTPSTWVDYKIESELADGFRGVLMGAHMAGRLSLKGSRRVLSLSEGVQGSGARGSEEREGRAGERRWVDVMPDPDSEVPDEKVATRDLLDTLLGKLPERERAWVDAHFLQGKEIREIAEAEGLDRSRVSEVVMESIQSIRADPEARRILGPFLPRIRSEGLDAFVILIQGDPVLRVRYDGLKVEPLDPDRLLRSIRGTSLDVFFREIERTLVLAVYARTGDKDQTASYFSIPRGRIETALGYQLPLPDPEGSEFKAPPFGFPLGASVLVHRMSSTGFLAELERTILRLAFERAGSVSKVAEWFQLPEQSPTLRQLAKAGGLEEVVTSEREGTDARAFAREARATSVRVVLGPTAFRQVRGLRRAVEVLSRAGLRERFVLLPDEKMAPEESRVRLADAATRLLSTPDLSVVAYAARGDPVMGRFLDWLRPWGVSFQPQEPMVLGPLVRQILLDLGVPEGTATQEAVARFLSLVGLEEAA